MQYGINNYSHNAVHYIPMTYIYFVTINLYLLITLPLCHQFILLYHPLLILLHKILFSDVFIIVD